MLDEDTVARLSAGLSSLAGGFLRSPVRRAGVTCADCAAPVDGYQRCFYCNRHKSRDGLADAIGILTYAVAGQQSGYVMRGYKAPAAPEEHQVIVTLLALLALSIHAPCPGLLAGRPVTHWATVPSFPAKPGEHPLHTIVKELAPGSEVRLAAARGASRPRAVSPDHFQAEAELRSDSHVLLLDDTWATGGHAQSAVLALRKAGAGHVSVLVIARWLTAEFGGNATFLRYRSNQDYDPRTCPWTGCACPTA
jgi:predicted amidophosphoribosyltransferase